jgi:hypothetical protein
VSFTARGAIAGEQEKELHAAPSARSLTRAASAPRTLAHPEVPARIIHIKLPLEFHNPGHAAPCRRAENRTPPNLPSPDLAQLHLDWNTCPAVP